MKNLVFEEFETTMGEETVRRGAEPLPKILDGMLQELVCLVRTEVSDSRGVEYVVAALHPLASLLHGSSLHRPYDWSDDGSSNAVQQLAAECRKKAEADHGEDEADGALRLSFYGGGSFTVLANILLHQVAPDWLACLPTAAQHAYFDQFFLFARPMDALLALVPVIYPRTSDANSDDDFGASSWQAERLLVLRFVKTSGFKDVALAFGDSSQLTMDSSARLAGGASSKTQSDNMQLAIQVAQVVASVPDRAGRNAPEELRSPLYFKLVTTQLLTAAAERWTKISERRNLTDEDPVFGFITETLSRLCRRGHADVVASQMIAALIDHLGETLAPSTITTGVLEKAATFWPSFAMVFNDSHATERWAEALIREMDEQGITDAQAHTIFWNLFGALREPVFRSIFLEKFLFWKVFPVRCLKWLLNFAVFRSWPAPGKQGAPEDTALEAEVVKRIAETWSQKQFIQSVQLNQQAYLTAALGICLQAMKKEQINSTCNLVAYILQGVTNRLESPIAQVRDMAARVALAFSLAVDPEKPLWLDDSDKHEDLLDWESLLPAARKGIRKGILITSTPVPSVPTQLSTDKQNAKEERRRKERTKVLDSQEDDPDAVVNYAEDGLQDWQDEDNAASMDSDAESESSLQPYDMSDDDTDLEREKYPAQLSECALSLRKGDNPDAVEKALQVVNTLVRAVPDELDAISPNLAHALVHVRCSAIAVEGEEESAELKRHNALVSLLVCSPFKTVEVLTKELYSAQVDISQRLLILEVMADAARELASSTASSISQDQYRGAVVVQLDGASDPLAWYGPGSSKGPAGSGPWMDVSQRTPGDSLVSWGPVYERVLPPRPGDKKLGKSRRWGNRSVQLREERWKRNSAAAQSPKFRFADLAAIFMLPVMRLYDQKSHGVDFVNRDFIVLGRLLYMLGVCMEGIALQPEAPMLGIHLVDLLRSRAISNHPEAFVRRSAIYAASRVIVALHPSQVVTALSGGDSAFSDGLQWIREWALQIAEIDPDTECANMAMACLQLHSEMALQASRQLDSSSQTSGLRLKDPGRPLVMSL